MAYLALYRRYRPDSFDNLIGQEHIVKTLVNQIENQKIGHAYLFTGTRGTGKTSCAKIFAKAINCLSPVNGSPCGKCEVCKALSDPSNIDVIEIDAASNNGVNEIRDLRENVQYPPVNGRYKVYIIDEVHMLTGAAFNALLKTLEEPPKHAVFILATTEVHKIPATILSRCMRFDFRLISTDKIAELIANIYDEQGKKYENEAVYAIASAGDGSIRDALSIADTALSYGDGKLCYDDVMEILGSSNNDILTYFIESILDGNTGVALDTVDKLCLMGKSIGVLTKDVKEFLRRLIIIKTCEDPNKILNIPESKFKDYKKISDNTTEERLIRMLEIFSETENSLKFSVHPRIIFETATVKCAKPDADYDIDALLARISELELKLEKGVKIVKEEVSPSPVISLVDKKPVEEKVELKPEIKTETIEEKPVRKSLITAPIGEIKGTLLSNLRAVGKEMLWNVLQSVGIEVNGNVLTFTTPGEIDAEILESHENKEAVEDALKEFMPFEIYVKLVSGIDYDKIDEEAEKIKKIFGDDIVIIKD